MKHRSVLTALALLVSAVACRTAADNGNPAFELASSPQFVNRLIPGHRPVALIEASGATGDPITLTGSSDLTGATVEFLPAQLDVPGVTEVWLNVPEVGGEVPVTVAITGTRGDEKRAITLTATAVPGVDDLAPIATDIAAVFLRDLAGTVPELPTDRSGLAGGTPVAGLLVVTHYAWFTPTAEISLGWHIMVAPDDWAELYVRPRGVLTPTKAFRLSSWSTALNGGAVTITEVTPPAEVTR